MMRSAARLTYEEVQAARDGAPRCALPRESLAALYGAFAALAEARAGARRAGARDRARIVSCSTPKGGRSAVVRAVRLDSHRLIEEFMILANVAAAEELEARRRACMYRVHDAPDPEKVESLRAFLEETGIPGLALAKGQAIKPELFNRVLRRAAGTAGSRARQRPRPALPGASRLQPRTISVISAWLCAATPISPRRSGATPTSWCIER